MKTSVALEKGGMASGVNTYLPFCLLLFFESVVPTGLYRLLEGKVSKGLPIWKRVGDGQEAWIYRRLAQWTLVWSTTFSPSDGKASVL